MILRFKLLILFILLVATTMCFGQEYEMSTLFKGPKHRASGGYAAISNKFTTFRGEYANMAEVYGGWYINHRFLLGLGVSAITNNAEVPMVYSTVPDVEMSYAYGQFGLMTEYTLWSHRAIHLSFHMMNGAGFTVQYQRKHWEDDDRWRDDEDYPHDSNWFYVAEPGVQVEMNVFRWLRFSPGVSYRAAFGSDGKGLKDSDISGMSVNLTLKIGKF